MQLEPMTDDELEQSTIKAVRAERESTTNVLHHLQEVEVRRLYCKHKLSSLFAYCMKVLKYSEDQTNRRISAMRLMRELPSIEEKIESGALSLSHLNKAQEMFRREKKAQRPRSKAAKLEVLSRIEQLPILEVKKTLELETYAPEPKKVAPPVTLDQFPAEVQSQLKRLLDVRSHTLNGNDLVALIGQLTELGLDKWDESRKAARAEKAKLARIAKGENENELAAGDDSADAPSEQIDAVVPAISRVSDRSYISASARQQVYIRDGGCCTNCGSSRHVQVNHIIPPILGGDSDVSNLRLRCRSCNLRHAVETYGRSKMQNYLREAGRPYQLSC